MKKKRSSLVEEEGRSNVSTLDAGLNCKEQDTGELGEGNFAMSLLDAICIDRQRGFDATTMLRRLECESRSILWNDSGEPIINPSIKLSRN